MDAAQAAGSVLGSYNSPDLVPEAKAAAVR
jgi:hypothetical protein